MYSRSLACAACLALASSDSATDDELSAMRRYFFIAFCGPGFIG